jgi:starch phosphorylase
VEIREAVGEENFFLFGLNAVEIARMSAAGYRPREIYEGNPELKAAIDLIGGGAFCAGDASVFTPLVDHLLWHDTYFVLADFAAYVLCQERVTEAYLDVKRWARMSILNVARSGRFSSDRTINEYCREIWRVPPVPVGSAGHA